MKRILLVEDDEGFSDSVSRALSLAGLEVLNASNWKEAYDLIEDEDLNFVLTDYDLRDTMNGADLIYYLNLDYPTHGITTILWSGLDRTRDCVGVDIDHILTKDQIDKLLEILGV